MNIVHFSWEYPPAIWGGLGTFVFEITQKQVQLNHKVHVYALNNKNQLKTNDVQNGVNVFRPELIELKNIFRLFANKDVASWGSHFQFFSDVINYNITSAYQCVQQVASEKQFSPDIIDGHDWLGSSAAMIVKEHFSFPFIFHVHSTEYGRSLGGGSETIKKIEYEAGQKADGIITVSHAMKKELIQLGFPKSKIRVCWNGVNPEKYNPKRFNQQDITELRKQYHIKDDETMLFFIGRLVTVKGPDKLLKAMPSVLRTFPKCKLVILGVGDLENRLSSLSKQLNIKNNVVIVPKFVSEENRMLHYAASDIVILPSLYEPFGIVCTEAMAMAKPVVVGATDTNGMREQVIPTGKGQCGYHVNPHDPKDIAWGIQQILQRKDKGRQLGLNARQRVINEFSWDVITQKTLAIYEEFLS
jgi:glycogen(starch) synthase